MPENTSPGYREFMRARRPELISDTRVEEVREIDRRQFEFHLHTLTSRNEHTPFESFARALAERELCPNLVPQTGPSGGGDGKVDTETYPVASSIANLWYEGDPMRAAGERWAFAISAKEKWRPKLLSDVQKIVDTGRAYTLIYFVSNQAIRDKDKAEVQDSLTQKYGIEVRVLDRMWVVDRVVGHSRWDLVAETLQFELPGRQKRVAGPLDVEREQELAELEKRLEAGADESVTPDNRRANRMKVLVHDGIGVWLAARRLNAGRFVWPRDVTGTLSLSRAQFDALVLGLPWQHVGEASVITLL